MIKAPTATEHQIQASMVDYAELLPWVFVFAIPNGAKLPYMKNAKGKRVSPQAMKLKKEGLKSGVADLGLMFRNGRMVFVEVKTADGVQSKEQKEFEALCKYMGFAYHIARTLDEFICILTKYRA